jgi:LAS superfamily LD-carboxypeptidase LdcB
MNSVNKFLVSLNIIALACFNYLHILLPAQANNTVLGASDDIDITEFSIELSQYKLEAESDYFVTQIQSSKILTQSMSGSYILSQAYTAPDKDNFIYKVYIKNTKSEKSLYELNLYSIDNETSAIYLYPTSTASGSFVLQPDMSTECYPVDKINVLTVNVTPEKCITDEVRKIIDLSTININGKKALVNEKIVPDLKELIKVAYSDKVQLGINSAYRSHKAQSKLQVEMQALYGENKSNELIADPGHSEHHLGTAIDFTSPEVGSEATPTFGDTRAFNWLVINAWKYGFVMSYPQDVSDLTGYTYEPWHWRYVGKMHAQIYNEFKILTLSEYLNLVSDSEKLY